MGEYIPVPYPKTLFTKRSGPKTEDYSQIVVKSPEEHATLTDAEPGRWHENPDGRDETNRPTSAMADELSLSKQIVEDQQKQLADLQSQLAQVQAESAAKLKAAQDEVAAKRGNR